MFPKYIYNKLEALINLFWNVAYTVRIKPPQSVTNFIEKLFFFFFRGERNGKLIGQIISARKSLIIKVIKKKEISYTWLLFAHPLSPGLRN